VAVITVSHSSQEALASYACLEERRMAVFAGRPFVIDEEGRADGKGPLDARFYAMATREEVRGVSGRCAIARYAEETRALEIYTDRIGAYPVYEATADGIRWFSNRPAILAELIGATAYSELGLASFLTCGWGLGGTTIWSGVERLRSGCELRLTPDGAETTQLLSRESIVSYFGAGLDTFASARSLVAVMQGMADWPGRPLRVGLTGGRDSRVVYAAAIAAGLDFEEMTLAFPNTPGFPNTGDVVVARRVAATFDRTVAVEVPSPGSGVRQTARTVRLVSNGLVSIATTGAVTLPAPGLPLPIVFSGQGGELARAHFGAPRADETQEQLADSLYRHLVPAYPKPVVTDDAERLVRDWVRAWVTQEVEGGTSPADIPDLFYLVERMGNWAGPSHAVYECVNDVVSPFWTPEMLPHELGLEPSARRQEHFHLRMLEALAPPLARMSFAGVDPPWPGLRGARSAKSQKYRTLASKVAREARRRSAAYRRRDAAGGDPFLAEAVASARESVSAQPEHAAWEVLDRSRVQRLLSRRQASLDPRSSRQLMTIVSIFAAE
jgi:hypothetical protein